MRCSVWLMKESIDIATLLSRESGISAIACPSCSVSLAIFGNSELRRFISRRIRMMKMGVSRKIGKAMPPRKETCSAPSPKRWLPPAKPMRTNPDSSLPLKTGAKNSITGRPSLRTFAFSTLTQELGSPLRLAGGVVTPGTVVSWTIRPALSVSAMYWRPVAAWASSRFCIKGKKRPLSSSSLAGMFDNILTRLTPTLRLLACDSLARWLRRMPTISAITTSDETIITMPVKSFSLLTNLFAASIVNPVTGRFLPGKNQNKGPIRNAWMRGAGEFRSRSAARL